MNNLTKLSLDVRFSTEFKKAIPFIYRIEEIKSKLVIEKFNISSVDPKSKKVDVEIQVALFTQAPSFTADGS